MQYRVCKYIIKGVWTCFQDCGPASYYAVFDGHNGLDAAVYGVSHLHQFLVESQNYPTDPVLAFKDAFKKTDKQFIYKSGKEVQFN